MLTKPPIIFSGIRSRAKFDNMQLTRMENERVLLQAALDDKKSATERNRLGQFATPTALAVDILEYAKGLLGSRQKVRFLDPAFGTGAFYSALLSCFPTSRIEQARAFEIDPHYGHPAAKLWKQQSLKLSLSDFTAAPPTPKFNLVICNPPYVRHHHLDSTTKRRLQLLTQRASGMKISGLAGLYCHFLSISHAWMDDNAIAGWLIPSEFMDVNYGTAVKRYLLERVTLLHIHRFDPNDVQFADALVSSAIVWFRKAPPPANQEVKFTFGGTLSDPTLTRMLPATALAQERKWTRFPNADARVTSRIPTLGDFFQIKRGLATGGNGYFILSEQDLAARGLPRHLFRPILPSPRHLRQDEVEARPDGSPDIDRRLFLLDTKLDEAEIEKRYPKLAAYLEEGKSRGIHARYLCRHRRPWYSQENRPAAPIVCTYLGRGDAKNGRPFRFILNGSNATVANVYLALYPTPALARAPQVHPTLIRRIWKILNQLSASELLHEGRVYGGGLHKLEPRELANVPVPWIAALLPNVGEPALQGDLRANMVA